ncbi:MAG: fibronectin type III domain-containing protein [Phycisphaeraceae bacterium]|nr:fibronectin type III domain-containing protein [Phycisphaeraceae bacterium]
MMRILLVAVGLAAITAFSSRAAADEVQAIHLNLLGASVHHSPVLVILEVKGDQLRAAAVTEPYRTGRQRGEPAGNLRVDAVAVDDLTWDGSRLRGSLKHGDEFAIGLNVTRDEYILRGRYEWTDARGSDKHAADGEVHGMLVPLPEWSKADHLTLYIRNPLPGHADGGRWNRHSRAIAGITLKEGRPQAITLIDSSTHAASRHTRQSMRVVLAGGRVGYHAVDGPRGTTEDVSNLKNPKISGDVNQGRLTIEAVYDGGPVTYHMELHRVGDLVFGRYRIVGDEDHGAQEVAGYWGRSGHLAFPLREQADGMRGENELRTHLRWLTDVNPYGGGLFGNDLALGDVRNTGSKDYCDPPMVGGFGPMAMRAVVQTSDDPLLRAQALMTAQRAGHYILSHRVGPYNLLPTYKTMFRPQYWMGRALVDLAVITESDFWKARALEVADALRHTQDEHGSWSYVSAQSGEVGTTLSRHDRSWDNVPRANGMWLELLGRIRTELGVEDYRDVEERAATWMRKALLEGVTHQGRRYLIEGRSDGSRPDDDGPMFYALYQLRYADKWDPELFAATIEWAEMLWHEGPDRLPRISYYQSRGPTGMETVGTMRMALIYLAAAEKTDSDEYLRKAGQLFHTVHSMYRPRTGVIWDSSVWDQRDVRLWSGHAYAVLPAEVALNLIEFNRIAARMAEAGRPVPQPQTIEFPEIENQPGKPGRITLGAASSSGLQVRYEVDSGPARVDGQELVLEGEPGIVWVTAHQDGNAAHIPALSVQRYFAVGDATPPAPTNVRTWTINNRAVRVYWEASGGTDIRHHTVQSSTDGGKTWRQIGRTPADVLHFEAGGMSNGETRHFRVLAHNPAFASDPSPMAAGTTHERNFHVEIDFDKITLGKHWELRADDDAPGGRILVPVRSSTDNVIDPDLSFSFTIDIGSQPGRYEVHYYCWGNAGSNDSAWIRGGNDEQWTWTAIGNQEWTWQSRGLELKEPGKHTIHFGARQHGNDGPRIGTIIVTNTNSRRAPATR